MLLGYSTYFTTIIRSNADPAVEHVQCRQSRQPVVISAATSTVTWPLLYGPDFTDRAPRVDGGTLYVKGKEKIRGRRQDDRTGLEQHSLFPPLSPHVGRE